MSLPYLDMKHINLLKQFLHKDFLTLNLLSDKLGVSERTVSNYIKQTNDSLKNIAQIKNKWGKGYYLTIHDRETFNRVMDENDRQTEPDSFQKRLAFIFSRLMASGEKNTLDELADELNVSRTTLVNDLKKASLVTNAYHLSISGKPNHGLTIRGDEMSLRLFVVENLYEHMFADATIDREIEQYILQLAKQYDYDSETTKRLIKFVIIMLDRYFNGHPIQSLDEKYKRLVGTEEFGIALSIKEKIEEFLSVDIPVNESVFLAIPITGRRTPMSIRSVQNVKIPSQITDLIKRIKNRIAYELNIFLNETEFSKDMGYHITFMVNRLIFGIQNPNPLTSEVKEKYPLAFKMAKIAGEIIEEEIGIQPPDDELAYLTFYFELYLYELEMNLKKFKKVAIVCSTGRGTAQIIVLQLRKILGNEPVVDIYSEELIEKDVLAKYDLIFTTLPLDLKINVPIIKISEIFDQSVIAKQLDKIIYLQNYEKNMQYSSSSIIAGLADENRFFTLSGDIDYKDHICTMANHLVQQGSVDQAFTERLLQREEQSTTVFDRMIAVPHAVNYASNQIILAIGVLPESIKRANHDVRLIFMLAIPENEEQNTTGLLVKLYEEIIEIANDQKMVDKLANCKTFEELFFTLND